LLNLNVQRLSSFEDKVTPAMNVSVHVRVPFQARTVTALSADAEGTRGVLPFTSGKEKSGFLLDIAIPRLVLSTILRVE
jgi:hypothetical protein